MMKRSFRLLGFVCCFALAANVFAQESYQPLRVVDAPVQVLPPPRIPVIGIPRIVVHPEYKQMTIKDLSVKANIIGNVATTTYEMEILNPNPATLEAEFIFPLNENQTVVAVALDINGRMREGVVVEKEKARQTFEAVVRQGVDPLLVEKTSGNQFKTRIYPFNPNGTRRIRIVLEENLQKHDGSYTYNLPLTFNQKLDRFDLDIQIPTDSKDLPVIESDIVQFNQSGQLIRSEFLAQDYLLDTTLTFKLPDLDEKQIFTHKQGNQTYFYGVADVDKSARLKTLPKNLTILWDASLSASKRDITKEKELLMAYLKKVKNTTVTFVSFNIETGASKKFVVKNGLAGSLEKHIDSIVYDGATRFDTLNLNKIQSDEILMFTDGITTFAKDIRLALPKQPLYVINSSSEFEPELLKGWANKTFGRFVNLQTLTTEQALDQLLEQPLRIVGYKKKNLSQLYPVVGTPVDESVNFVGVLNANEGELEISFGYDENSVTQTHKVNIPSAGDNSAVARLWAIQKIAYLSQNPTKNKEAILKLGQQYSVVTDNTSLLVLENASDYWRYRITPPADLRDEYNRLQKDFDQSEKAKKDSALNQALSMAKRVKEWWQKDFDIAKIKQQKYEQLKPQNGEESTEVLHASEEDVLVVESNARMVPVPRGEVMVMADAAPMPMASISAAPVMMARRSVRAVAVDGKVVSSPKTTSQAKIQVKAWDPEVPYLKILKASKDKELYADYLKLKTGYADQPSFYFDVVDEFIRRGQNDKALVVLSNVSEMKLDNVELIRITANKLMQMNQTALAVQLFEKVTELRGEDPQSFRDLALAYQADKQYQKAFDTFYQILTKDWARFNEIKQIIFVEMNNLLSLHPEVDTKDMDKELIFSMPVDIRIVLGWSTDNTDIDLHVVDPLNEECYYGHKETLIGGRYPYDFTQGFGPEEFMAKKAADGKYVVRTNNFGDHRQSISGPTTLYLDLYTNYSKPNQNHERILVRAGQVKDKNEIGDIVWGEISNE